MKEQLTYDYSIGFDFDIMEKAIIESAKEMNVTAEKYIEDAKKEHSDMVKFHLFQIVSSLDPIETVGLIDDYNEAMSAYTYCDRFEFEMKLTPEER
jgi:hypothetical protein